jgi:hypothetical protein
VILPTAVTRTEPKRLSQGSLAAKALLETDNVQDVRSRVVVKFAKALRAPVTELLG